MRDERLLRAAKLLRSGEQAKAEVLLQVVVGEQPESAEGWHLLGLSALLSGDFAQAQERLEKAVLLGPEVANHHYNLAGAFYSQQRWEEAAESYRRAATLAPGFFEAWKGRGAAFLKMGRAAEAESALRQSLEMNAKQPLVWVDLAEALTTLNNPKEAIAALHQALVVDASCVEAHRGLAKLFGRAGDRRNEATAHYNLGALLWRQGCQGEAVPAFERALALNPANGRAQHALAALRGETPITAPREYVIDLFDQYAGHFDSHLALLQYRIPELMLETALRLGVQSNAPLRVLDLGCGSGKAGTLFRDRAAHLCGIDLSPRMIEQSRLPGAYDELIQGDIVDAMRMRVDKFDLILAADVFIYVGELKAVFEQCQRICAPRAWLMFSVESWEGAGYTLRPSGRFAHSRTYLHSMAERHGFTVLSEENVTIRQQQEGAIPGSLYVLAKSLG